MDTYVVKIRETFREEVYELIAELETVLLEMEKAPHDQDLIDRAFRAMHTIKGSSATCEFNDVASFTHDLETALDQVRQGKITATKELISVSLSARDQIKDMFDVYYCGGSADKTRAGSILASLRTLIPSLNEKNASLSSPERGKKKEPLAESMNNTVTYRIRFRPMNDIFTRGINPVYMISELRQLGTCRVFAQRDGIPLLNDFDIEACYTYWDMILTTNQDVNTIEDVFIFVKDECEVTIDIIDRDGSLDDEVSYKKLGDILLDRGDLTPDDLNVVLKAQKRFGEMLVEKGLVAADKVESALVEQQTVREAREKRQEADTASSIRVSIEKLDTLVNLVGELVTVQARLSQTSSLKGFPEFVSIAEEVERLTTNLRDNTMNIRMLPIGTTFSKFKRLVRTLSQELHKEIELTTEGADTELDKTVIERLSDPFTHLIRNSIDHGIETPEDREAHGKPRMGTIQLSATHVGANVVIQIKDDGKGLDSEVIRAKAVEKGLLSADADVSEKEIFMLIMEPGFSTAKTVTSVSGRGVGMDVVKKAIDALRGTIDINSQKGVGTTISLTLPLTLAIIDGFLVSVAGEFFVIPLSVVAECNQLTKSDVEAMHGRNIVNLRGSVVPYIHLREVFSIDGDRPAIEYVVIVEINQNRVGFVADQIIGQHQTVLKALGSMYRNTEGLSGATLLGDGTVALVLDVAALVKGVERDAVAAVG